LGSGSIALACHDFGVSLDGFEISEKYYKAAQERLAVHTKQLALDF
jgi:site-specific DNA-methyltransferase (adenine-specific)